MTKLQITLTDQEVKLLARKAADLGYDVTKYAKFVLAREAAAELKGIPFYKATPNMEKIIANAIQDDDQGKTQSWLLGEYDN